jgi:hypothetical protein
LPNGPDEPTKRTGKANRQYEPTKRTGKIRVSVKTIEFQRQPAGTNFSSALDRCDKCYKCYTFRFYDFVTAEFWVA